MWLLHTTTFTLREFYGRYKPKYAILSHTWGDEEVSFADLQRQPRYILYGAEKARSKLKILTFCQKAREHNLEWSWVDTCCINKSSSAELSEAINSMYRWYRDSEMCFVYLADVSWSLEGNLEPQADQGKEAFRASRWFTRGWTLQELLAPRRLYFCDRSWEVTVKRADMAEEILSASGIPKKALTDSKPYSVAEKMYWASKRQTTREEDVAYCLLGLFNVNMPLLYGEGEQKAFQRLQVEIMQQSPDESIFAWERPGRLAATSGGLPSGLLAESPAYFENSSGIKFAPYLWRRPYIMTHIGVQIELDLHSTDRYMDKLPEVSPLKWAASNSTGSSGEGAGEDMYLGTPQRKAAALRCKRDNSNLLVIFLRPNGHNSYSRIGPLVESNKAQLGPMTECYVRDQYAESVGGLYEESSEWSDLKITVSEVE